MRCHKKLSILGAMRLFNKIRPIDANSESVLILLRPSDHVRMFPNHGVPEVRENICYSVVMFKLIKQKSYRLGLLFTHDNSGFGRRSF